jgi:hypothetical protein
VNPVDKEVFTAALRNEPFGAWARIRELLSEEGLDPILVQVRKVSEGWTALPPPGERFEFLVGGRVMFSARIKSEGDPTTWAIVEWQAAPDSG